MRDRRECPKCGGQFVSVRYVAATDARAEFLAAACRECEYRWDTPTQAQIGEATVRAYFSRAEKGWL
jgi:transcription elongation factor Elf1